MEVKFNAVEWAKSATIYEVNVRQYTKEGTFEAFGKHLPRLHDMGINVLWFMPVTPISNVKRLGTLGSYYSCSDYTSINPEFGTIEDFKTLIVAAHEQGFKVMIDWVANHTGWNHTWTQEHPEFYKKDTDGNFYDSNGWEDVIDLDYSSRRMRHAMIAAMNYWIKECDIDGFRCDMAHLIPLDFWREARETLDNAKQLFWLAETEEPAYHDVFDATYAWELLHKMEAVYKGSADVKHLDGVLKKYNTVFTKDAMRLFFITNHDENSHSGSEFERMGVASKAFAVLCATWHNSIPLIYSGQELPNVKRLKFFDKDEIEWKERVELHSFYKVLLRLHQDHPALQAGDDDIITTRLLTTADDLVLAFIRQKQERQVMVLLNLSPNDRVKFEVLNESVTGTFTSAFSGIENDFTNDKSFELQAWEFLVYHK
ncbi:MAG TPA: alpha-amylase family glycosyl hydrolase [Segetibacter sp.]|jgi:glycosidase